MGLQPAAAWQLSHGTASGPCGFGRCALATAERDPTKTTQDKVSKIMKEIRVNALGAPLRNCDCARGVRGVDDSILRINRVGTTVPKARNDTKATNDTKARDDPICGSIRIFQ